jgi:hypothetical protein
MGYVNHFHFKTYPFRGINSIQNIECQGIALQGYNLVGGEGEMIPLDVQSMVCGRE